MDDTLILDCEVYRNFFYLGVKRLSDGKRAGYEFSPRADFDRDKVRALMRRYQTVGFNSVPYDLPMIYMALSGASNSDIKDASDHIIQNRIPYWKAADELGITIPMNRLDHIDLFETNPAVKKGLKALNGSMHHKRLQELPFEHTRVLNYEEMDALIEYCQFGDIDGTEMLFNALKEAIKLRADLGTQSGLELRSASDAQVGERLIKKTVEDKTGDKIKKAIIPDGTTFRYEPPEWMEFKTPYMRHVLETIRNTDIQIKGGKVEFPKEFEQFEIIFDGMRHTLGIGGLHSTESNRAVHSTLTHVLIDADIASQYPNIIKKLGLFPKAMGPDFLIVWNEIISKRLAAKKRAKEVSAEIDRLDGQEPSDQIRARLKELKAEKAMLSVQDKGAKISLNGSYGKLGSAYSVLFAPHLMVAVTLTGQLSLLMLIEEASLRGIPVVSANTDGVLFACPRSKFNGFIMRDGAPTDRLAPSQLQDIIDWWEGITSFNLEFGEYRSVYSQSVNSYMAIKPDGSFKRKGKLANHWREELPWGGKNGDFDPAREGLKKAPAMTICVDAALGMILHGIPVEKTITECTDIREFVTITAATGGATWGPGAPIYGVHERVDNKGKTLRSKILTGYEGEFYLGKLVRFYWSREGNPIIRLKGHASTGNRGIVAKTEGCRPAMTLPDDFAVPADLDYARYIAEAHGILKDIGFVAQSSDCLASRLYASLLEVA